MDECPVCFESFGVCVPKMLVSCGHTICVNCLQNLVADKKIKCPFCRRVTVLSNNVDDLPTNFAFITEKKNKSRSKAKRKGKEKNEEDLLCKEHSKKFELFCDNLDCLKLICKDCKSHKNHPYLFIDDALQTYGGKISKNIQLAIEKVNTETKSLKNTTNTFQNKRLTVENEVRDTMNQIREWATQRERILLANINEKSTEIHSSLSSHQQLLVEIKQPLIDIQTQLVENRSNNNNNNNNNSPTFPLSLLKNVQQYSQQIDRALNSNLKSDVDIKLSDPLVFKQLGDEKKIIQDLISNFGKIVVNQSKSNKTNQPFSIETPRSFTTSTTSTTTSIASSSTQRTPPIINPRTFRDYKQLLPNGNQKSKRIYGPDLGIDFEKQSSPREITIIPKEWFIKSNQGSTRTRQPPPFSNDDLLVVSDSSDRRVVLIEKTSGNVKSTIHTTINSLWNIFSNEVRGVAVTKRSTHPNVILFVGDFKGNVIQCFDIETGQYLESFTHEKYMKSPRSIAINQQNGHIIVANYGGTLSKGTITIHYGYPNNNDDNNNNNNNYTPALGTLFRVIGDNDSFFFYQPRSVTVNSRGYMIVSVDQEIIIFDNNYNTLKTFKPQSESDWVFPHAVCVDQLDNILVGTSNSSIQVFDSEGNFIHEFGKQGNDYFGFQEVMGIAVDHKSGDIFVVDSENHRVMVF